MRRAVFLLPRRRSAQRFFRPLSRTLWAEWNKPAFADCRVSRSRDCRLRRQRSFLSLRLQPLTMLYSTQRQRSLARLLQAIWRWFFVCAFFTSPQFSTNKVYNFSVCVGIYGFHARILHCGFYCARQIVAKMRILF